MNFERNLQQNCFLQEQLTQSLFDHIPVGVGSKGVIPMNAKELEEALEMGMDWSLRQGYIWAEDKEHCEEYGRMLQADPNKVSSRAKKRGLPQLGTLGAGNHYAEIQVAEEIYDRHAAMKMGIEQEGQVRRCSFALLLGERAHRGLLPGVRHDSLRLARHGPSGGDGRARCDGEGDEEGQDRGKRPAVGVCSHQF